MDRPGTQGLAQSVSPALTGQDVQALTIDITDNYIQYMRTQAPLLAPIFRSDGQARLLSVLLLGDADLSISDIADRAGLAYPTAHREVERLIGAGILSERRVGRSRLISANAASPLTPPVREILLVSTGPVVLLAELFQLIPGIESAIIYGSFAARMKGVAGPAPHDIDVMVIGAPDPAMVYDACSKVEESVSRPVNPTILTASEIGEQSGFLTDLRSQPVVPIVGTWPWD